MANQKVLIIDDGKTIRMQVRDMLPKNTFEVLEAKDGVEGLDMMHQEHPHLILLDFFMPRMNGWEVLEKMKEHRELQAIPLVVMSGRKEEVTEKVPHLFEAFEFIEKPFDQKALIGAIKSAMAKAKKRQLAVATPAASTVGGDPIQTLKAEIKGLHEKDAKMQAEIDGLKKQLSQVLAFIKQKKA